MGALARRFFRLTGAWERLLYRAAALFVLLLLLSQLGMVNDSVRSRISRVDSMEGRPYGEEKQAE